MKPDGPDADSASRSVIEIRLSILEDREMKLRQKSRTT